MDWNFGNGSDDLVCPKDWKVPDCLLQWGVDTSESLESSYQNCVRETNMSMGELEFEGKGLHKEVEKETSVNDVGLSSKSCGCGGFSSVDYGDGNTEASLYRDTFLCDRPDYHLDGLAEMDQNDDIFMSSLLKEDPFDMENLYRPVDVFSEFECSTTPPKNIWTDMMVDSPGNLSDRSGINRSNSLKAYGFPPSVPSHQSQMKDCPIKQESEDKVVISSEPKSPCQLDGCIEVESLLEESVLQELEVVMTKLTQETRICFRDALYRLSKRSEQHMASESQNGEIEVERPYLSTVHNKASRTIVKQKESETNAIDRTIANLMFNELRFDTQDISSKASIDLSEEDVITTGSCNNGLNQPKNFHCPHPRSSLGFAEVPTFGMEN